MSVPVVRTAKPAPVRRCLASALALALCAGAAQAATFTAGSEAELIQAINDANANAGGDTIEVGSDITLTAQLPVITKALTIEGAGGVNRALTRDDTGANACSPTATNAFRLIDASADLTLSDLTLSGGCNLFDQGGAVRVQNAELTVARSTISGNQTFFPDPAGYCYGVCIGGGIAVLYGSASISDSTISGNVVNGYGGTGGGIAAYESDLVITNSTISGNAAPNGLYAGGGGVYGIGVFPNGPVGAVTITNSTLADNRAPFGAGLGAIVDAVTIVDSRVTGNIGNGSHARGAGILIQNTYVNATSRVTRTLISGNTIDAELGYGGGIRVNGGSFELVDSTVVDNSVTGTVKARAGAIMAEIADVTITNSTLSGNTVNGPASGGGAIMVDSDNDLVSGSFVLRNSTVTGNSSNNTGGGIYIKCDTATALVPPVTIESSIIAGNQGAGGLDAIGTEPATAAVVTADHSLIQGSVDVATGTVSWDATTQSLLNLEPMLLPLADNGGITPTCALMPSSPALDQGTNSQSLEYDQRGWPFARQVGSGVDIGAYELNPEIIFAGGFD
ncbi:MAG: choice-of-anchor Q domain-containing protein [Lysobacterales bacterium]